MRSTTTTTTTTMSASANDVKSFGENSCNYLIQLTNKFKILTIDDRHSNRIVVWAINSKRVDNSTGKIGALLVIANYIDRMWEAIGSEESIGG